MKCKKWKSESCVGVGKAEDARGMLPFWQSEFEWNSYQLNLKWKKDGARREETLNARSATCFTTFRDCHLFGRNSYQSMNSRFLAGIAEHTLGKVRRMVWIWLALLLTKSLSHITLQRMVIILLFANKLTPISTLSLLAALSSKLQIYSTNKSNIKYSNNMVKNSVTFHQVIQLSIYAVDFVLSPSRR